MKLVIGAVAWLAVFVPTSVLAQSGAVYRWKDANGKVHFSNVQPADGVVPEGAKVVAPETVPRAPVEPGPSDMPMPVPDTNPVVAAPAVPVSTPGPYSTLEGDVFSSTVSRERGVLKRELAAAKREVDQAKKELASENARKAVPTPAQVHDRIFLGVTGVEFGPRPDREKELTERMERAEKRVEEIRAKYGQLESEAVKRYGSLPGWWLPLD